MYSNYKTKGAIYIFDNQSEEKNVKYHKGCIFNMTSKFLDVVTYF